MRPALRLPGGAIIMFALFANLACDRPARAAGELPEPRQDSPPATQPSQQTAVFAAGCFWCVEAVFDQLQGVSDVVSGYAGGSGQTATYQQVSEGSTQHAEAVQITYDASKLTYGQLVRVFFATHDPTTQDRQGPDSGRQYRSAIFYADDQQKRIAEAYIGQLTEAKAFSRPIVTTLEPLDRFYPAEQYHQDFAGTNPAHPYVRQWIPPKLEKLQKQFGDQLKQPAGQKR